MAKIKKFEEKIHFLCYALIYTKYTVIYCNQSIASKSTLSGCFQHGKLHMTLKFCKKNDAMKKIHFLMLQCKQNRLRYTATRASLKRAALLAVFSIYNPNYKAL